jgi:hypothetical protein
MYKPRDILTEEGWLDYLMHLRNMEKAVDFILNHADDLHLGANRGVDEGAFLALVAMNKLLGSKFLLHGDGEV